MSQNIPKPLNIQIYKNTEKLYCHIFLKLVLLNLFRFYVTTSLDSQFMAFF